MNQCIPIMENREFTNEGSKRGNKKQGKYKIARKH